MLDLGVIHRSESPFASNGVLVKKTDGSLHFCIDLRRLNTSPSRIKVQLHYAPLYLDKPGQLCQSNSRTRGRTCKQSDWPAQPCLCDFYSWADLGFLKDAKIVAWRHVNCSVLFSDWSEGWSVDARYKFVAGEGEGALTGCWTDITALVYQGTVERSVTGPWFVKVYDSVTFCSVIP